MYGVGGKLLKAVQSFYVDSRACVRVGKDVSEWFPVNVGLRQGCVMSPWFFNVYMDGVVREVNVRVLGKELELLSANGGRFEINQLLFADDTALAKKCLYEGVIVPTALYGAEAWGMRSADRRKVNVLEMKCLRSLVRVSRVWLELGMEKCLGELE